MQTREWIEKYANEEQLNRYHELNPQYDIKIIGVTGTIAKTTVVELCYQYLSFLGKKSFMVGTSGIKCNTNGLNFVNFPCTSAPNKQFLVDVFLQAYKEEQCEYLVLETTAESTSIGAFEDLDFEVLGLTNLYAGVVKSFDSDEDYFKHKAALYCNNNIKTFCVNEQCYPILMKYVPDDHVGEVVSYNKNKNIYYTDRLGYLTVIHENTTYATNLLSTINVDEVLCFLTMMKALLLFNTHLLQRFLAAVSIPGRLQVVEIDHRQIIIDTCYGGMDALLPYFNESDCTIPTTVILSTYFFNNDHDKSEDVKRKRMRKSSFFYERGIPTIITATGAKKNKNGEKGVAEIPDETVALEHLKEGNPNARVVSNRVDAIRMGFLETAPGGRLVILGMGTETYVEATNKETGEKVEVGDEFVVQQVAYELAALQNKKDN